MLAFTLAITSTVDCECENDKNPKTKAVAEPDKEQPAPDKHSYFGVWDITLRAEGHVYGVLHTPTGVVTNRGIGSVTTFLHAMFPPFVGVDVVQRMRPNRRQLKYGKMTDAEILTYWNDNGKYKADLGTDAHFVMETFLRSIMEAGWPGVIPPQPPHKPWVVHPSWPQNLGDAGIIINPKHIEDFKQYMEKNHLIPIAVEKCMYNKQLRLAGTVDALFRNTVTGKILLYDWKRRDEFTVENQWQCGNEGTPVYGHPDCHLTSAMLQLNLYRRMLHEGDGEGGERIEISEMHIISIHPNLPTFLDNLIPIDDGLMDLVWKYRLDRVALFCH